MAHTKADPTFVESIVLKTGGFEQNTIHWAGIIVSIVISYGRYSAVKTKKLEDETHMCLHRLEPWRIIFFIVRAENCLGQPSSMI